MTISDGVQRPDRCTNSTASRWVNSAGATETEGRNRVAGRYRSTGAEGVAVAVGIGVRPDTEADRIIRAVRAVVGDTTIVCLATLDRRAGEPGVRTAAADLGAAVMAFTAEQLAEVDAVRHRSDRVSAAVGTPSVAEAAALLAGGGELVCGRTIVDGIVVAAASVSPR
ncbi:cobalamin biosynthesis protein [Nocardia sp. IBHARD005]|uniref:cobalamin biosynthesis protein n=1 Tax=Nocardia sp. IBHARD005 TaxID=3457765 RepID=UPI004059DEF2